MIDPTEVRERMDRPREGWVAPRPSTPATDTPAGGAFAFLPSDLLEQTCKRVGIASLVFAGIWAWVLIMNNGVWRLFGPLPDHVAEWNVIGNPVSAIGLVMSIAMVLVAGRLHHEPERLLNVGLVFEVATASLIGAGNWWFAVQNGFGVSWICVVLIFYPAIVPAPVGRILVASLVAASMDPLWYWIGTLRGLEYGLGGYQLAWAFVPNYVCALLATVPAKVIRGLGQRVSAARQLGAYQIGELIRHGGMGDVYLATHRLLARPAAIKLIRTDALAGTGTVLVERFRREAHAAANLRSPHTIELYDFGVSDDGSLYYVMELLAGLDLQELVDRFGPVPAARAVHLLKQACLSLAEAHGRGLVHRDIKPSNLVACRLGVAVDFLKVLDFGLVKMSAGGEAAPPDLTSPNVTTGTPAYMAPEMALGDRPVDGRTDLYALGCVGYWLLTGRTPFEAATPVAMLMKHVQEEAKPPSALTEVEVPDPLDRILLDCLAKDPQARPSDASELYGRLSECPVPDVWSPARAREWWALHVPETLADSVATDVISDPVAGGEGRPIVKRTAPAPDR